jgi:hypothetical protein
MRWLWIVFAGLFYLGGLLGTKEFFETRFRCDLFRLDYAACGLFPALNVVLWPIEVGQEIALWAFQQQDARNKARLANSPGG